MRAERSSCAQGHSGLERLHNQTGWVYTAHNRMWSGEVTYAKANGCKGPNCFDFVVPEPGGKDQALPMTEDFWLWLIGDSVKWGLGVSAQQRQVLLTCLSTRLSTRLPTVAACSLLSLHGRCTSKIGSTRSSSE